MLFSYVLAFLQPSHGLYSLQVVSLNLEPTGAGIWGIKSVSEDFLLVQRSSKKCFLYFDSLRKSAFAALHWLLCPLGFIPGQESVCQAAFGTCLGGAGWVMLPLADLLRCSSRLPCSVNSWWRWQDRVRPNPGRKAGVSGRAEASPEKVSLGTGRFAVSTW